MVVSHFLQPEVYIDFTASAFLGCWYSNNFYRELLIHPLSDCEGNLVCKFLPFPTPLCLFFSLSNQSLHKETNCECRPWWNLQMPILGVKSAASFGPALTTNQSHQHVEKMWSTQVDIFVGVSDSSEPPMSHCYISKSISEKEITCISPFNTSN